MMTEKSAESFYTIGYEGLGIKRFIQILKENKIQTLADSRDNPFSMNLDFRQKKLMSHLEQHGIRYVHLKEYGIPSDMRKAGNPIEWYIENVKPKIQASILDSFEQPICFMCMEKDIESCHRKIILEALHEQGLRGRDLYPVSS